MKRFHAVLHGDAFQARDFQLTIDAGGEFFAVDHQFMDADPAFVAHASAGGATLRVGFEDLSGPA